MVVSNAGTGSEMEGAIICGLNVVGIEMSQVMYSNAARRLANVMQAQAFRLELARLEPEVPEDYVKRARLTLPAVILTSPEKRQRTHLQKSSMDGLDLLYHTVLNLPWPQPNKSTPAKNMMEAGLKIHIM